MLHNMLLEQTWVWNVEPAAIHACHSIEMDVFTPWKAATWKQITSLCVLMLNIWHVSSPSKAHTSNAASPQSMEGLHHEAQIHGLFWTGPGFCYQLLNLCFKKSRNTSGKATAQNENIVKVYISVNMPFCFSNVSVNVMHSSSSIW